MSEYVVKGYQEGYEEDQARIGIEVAKGWVWPFAYSTDDLKRIHSQPDFDPETRHYCFKGDEMVGYMFSTVFPPNDEGIFRARVDFPRMLPGHEEAAGLLIDRAFGVLREKGVNVVDTPVTTMWENNIGLAERAGFKTSENYGLGFKVYYAYDLRLGKLEIPSDSVKDFDLERDLEECAELAAIWYKRPKDWCKSFLEELCQTEEIIAHLVMWDQEEMVAACIAAPNSVQTDTLAGIYYIYVREAKYLRPLISKVISDCVDEGYETLIADLIDEHRGYEDDYKSLGFVKAAEWAVYQRAI